MPKNHVPHIGDKAALDKNVLNPRILTCEPHLSKSSTVLEQRTKFDLNTGIDGKDK